MTAPTNNLSGVWLPMITPFRDDELDAISVTRLVKHYAHQRIDGLILAATTGEGLTLNAEETHRLVFTAVQANEGLPLYLGISGSDTRKLVNVLQDSREWPIDGYLVTCPYYSRPSQEGIYAHFHTLSIATERPLMMYNIPYRTGVNMSNEILLRLAALPNIIGLKDCCANPAQSYELLQSRAPDFAVLTGEDAMFLSALCQDADGGILASAHVETAAFASVYEAMVNNDLALALRHWDALCAVPKLLFSEPNPSAIKHWLWRQGLIDSAQVRLPMMPVTEALSEKLDSEIVKRKAN